MTVSDGLADGQNPGDFGLDLSQADPSWVVQAGDVITVDHDTAAELKDHTVTSLTAGWVTGSQVAGTADDGSIGVWINNTNVSRHETVTGGAWSTDFSVPGDEEGEENTQPLAPGDNGPANQCDAENDCTWAELAGPEPAFQCWGQ